MIIKTDERFFYVALEYERNHCCSALWWPCFHTQERLDQFRQLSSNLASVTAYRDGTHLSKGINRKVRGLRLFLLNILHTSCTSYEILKIHRTTIWCRRWQLFLWTTEESLSPWRWILEEAKDKIILCNWKVETLVALVELVGEDEGVAELYWRHVVLLCDYKWLSLPSIYWLFSCRVEEEKLGNVQLGVKISW